MTRWICMRPKDIPACCGGAENANESCIFFKDLDVVPPSDNVNHPRHYTSHPSGIECIQITRHMSFNVGNAVKYLWRADLKGATIEDLKKARWYIDDEIKLREQGND